MTYLGFPPEHTVSEQPISTALGRRICISHKAFSLVHFPVSVCYQIKHKNPRDSGESSISERWDNQSRIASPGDSPEEVKPHECWEPVDSDKSFSENVTWWDPGWGTAPGSPPSLFLETGHCSSEGKPLMTLIHPIIHRAVGHPFYQSLGDTRRTRKKVAWSVWIHRQIQLEFLSAGCRL